MVMYDEGSVAICVWPLAACSRLQGHSSARKGIPGSLLAGGAREATPLRDMHDNKQTSNKRASKQVSSLVVS